MKVKRDWNHQPSIEKLISENLKTCIDNVLQPEPRKRWTVDNILDSNWIKMNRKLIRLNDQESLALLEALSSDKSANQKQLKKIEAKKSDTQQILNQQPQRFLSITQKIDSTTKSKENYDSNTSIYKLKQPMTETRYASNLQQIATENIKNKTII